MRKFRYKFNAFIKITIMAFILMWIAVICINIFKWVGIFNFYSKSLPFEITQTVISVFFILICILLLNLKYKINEDKIQLKLLFDLNGNQFIIKKISKSILYNNKLYICFTNKKNEPQIAGIMIDVKNYEAFNKALKEINPSIIIDTAEYIEEK